MERAVLHTEADRYVIVDYLAEGGMGAIYLGKKIGMGGFEKEVVLKQLLPEFTSQREFIDLFVREAKLSASLDHANIVHTIDFVAAGSDYFIVMEYVRGGDLRAILRRIKRRGGRLSAAACIFIAREVLSALAYAHEKKSSNGEPLKLIHRDVSPSNIMCSAVGEVKLTDFGIAKASTHKSIFYRVKGKVGYMSPEQAYGDRPLDHRSDLYSMAVVLYEMLAAERLFVADLLSTPDQIYSQPVKRLEGKYDAPRGIDAVLQKALARDPDDRYQNAGELLDGLAKVAYESGQIFTATDLANHLRKVCGDDASKWNRERDEDEQDEDRPGTQVLSGEAEQFSGVQLTSVLTESELGEDDDEDTTGDEYRSTPSTPAAEAKPARPRPKSDDAATRHIKIGPRTSGQLAPVDVRHSSAAQDFGANEYDDEPTRHLKVKPPMPGGGGSPQFDVGDSEMYAHAAHPPADAFDIDEDPTRINQGMTGPLPSNMLRTGMPAPPPPTHWGHPGHEDELTMAYAEPAPTTARGEFSVNVPPARADYAPMPAPTTPRRRRQSHIGVTDSDEGYASFPEADTDPRRRGHTAVPSGPMPRAEPKEAPTRLLDRSHSLPPPPVQPVAPPMAPAPPPPPLAPPRPRTLSPQRNNARRAQLPAPGRAPTPPAHAAPYHRTARVTAPVPRANRRRNAMLFAAGFLMLAAIAIVVIVGLSGPEIDRRGKGGSGGSGGSAGAISSNGSGGGSTTTVHAPVTAQADAASAAAADTGAAGDAGTRSATRADASRSGTSVTVESSPKKATVYLDGVKQCPAKCTVEGLDPNHTYLLSVRLRNYVPWSQLLRLGERRHVSVKAYLSEEPDPRNTGYLLVHVTPAADVTVDGTRIGRVTGDGRIPLSPGSHEIMLTRGERKLRFLVDIKKGQITSTEKLVLK